MTLSLRSSYTGKREWPVRMMTCSSSSYGRVDVEQVHVPRRHHHVAGGHVGHADHALEHHPRLRLDQLLLLGVGKRLHQLVARIGARDDEVDELLEEIAPLGGGGGLFGAARGAGGRRF